MGGCATLSLAKNTVASKNSVANERSDYQINNTAENVVMKTAMTK